LFKNICDGFNLKVKKIVISSINVDGIFSSIIYSEDQNGKQIEIDARTSDAVAIAVRFKAPIFTYEAIMDEAGILLDKDFMETDSQKQSIQETDNIFDNESDSSLKENLEKAISNEDYELASKIRDEIQKRSQS
jgi:bifunctional DNase/RNase